MSFKSAPKAIKGRINNKIEITPRQNTKDQKEQAYQDISNDYFLKLDRHTLHSARIYLKGWPFQFLDFSRRPRTDLRWSLNILSELNII